MSGITNPAEEYFKDGIWGWDGTVWRKLPLVWGYSDRWHQALSDLNASVGEDSLTTTPVPDGEVWILENASTQWGGVTCTLIELWIVQGATVTRLHVQSTPVSWQWEIWGGRVTLAKDDYIEAHFWGLTALDDIHLNVSGYKMKVAE